MKTIGDNRSLASNFLLSIGAFVAGFPPGCAQSFPAQKEQMTELQPGGGGAGFGGKGVEEKGVGGEAVKEQGVGEKSSQATAEKQQGSVGGGAQKEVMVQETKKTSATLQAPKCPTFDSTLPNLRCALVRPLKLELEETFYHCLENGSMEMQEVGL